MHIYYLYTSDLLYYSRPCPCFEIIAIIDNRWSIDTVSQISAHKSCFIETTPILFASQQCCFSRLTGNAISLFIYIEYIYSIL